MPPNLQPALHALSHLDSSSTYKWKKTGDKIPPCWHHWTSQIQYTTPPFDVHFLVGKYPHNIPRQYSKAIPFCFNLIKSCLWFTKSNTFEASIKHTKTVEFFSPIQILYYFLKSIHICAMHALALNPSLSRNIPPHSIKVDSFHYLG